MQIDLGKAKELFLAVMEMSAPERAAYLDTACAGDTALRQRVEAMLRTHENSGELLPRPPAEMIADANATEADATAAFAPQPRGPATFVDAVPTDAESLAFLMPSDKPGCLGRLGHYEVQEVVGKGGFGTVLKAFDEKLHRVVAIKVLSPAYAAVGSARKRFIREARTAAAVKNEYVVAIHGVEDEAQPPYLVMELIDGISLQDKLNKRGPLSLKEILRIGLQTAEGLAAAHKQGLVHRDIKPANILLENGVERVKITDFGLARAVDDASVTQSGTVAGTPMYMSPEQAEGLAIDHRSDLFSLGTVLYAMCTGRPPFRASGTMAVLKRVVEETPRPIREINSEIPDWLEATIAKLHAKKPDGRFQTATEVAELLGQHLAHLQQPNLVAPPPLTTLVKDKPKSYVPIPARVWYGAGLSAFGAELFLLGMAFRQDAWDLRTALLKGHAVFACVMLTFCGLWAAMRHAANPRWPLRLMQATIFCAVLSTACAVAFVLISLTTRGDTANPVQGPGVIAGRWDSNWGPVTLEHLPIHGSNPVVVTGSYQPEDDKKGVIDGAFDPVKGLLKISFSEPWWNGTGTAQLMLSPDGNELQGRWTNSADESGIWRMTRGTRPSPADESGWVPLYNGKDLTGWKPLPDQPSDWKVEERVLIGRSPPSSVLFSESGEYQDFHLRAEVYLNADGDSGLIFRAPFKDFAIDSSPGYEADLSFREGTPRSPIGSLWKAGKRMQKALKSATVPDQWFTLEVIAVGPRLKVLVNGNAAADYTGPNHDYRKGHIAVQAISWTDDIKGTVVRFRKIEIKELPPTQE